MSGTTAIAISSAANAQASAALSKAKDAACHAEMPGFEHDTATVQEMQGYAQCVQRLHPVDFDQEMQVIAWVVLACMVIGAVATGFMRWRSRQWWDVFQYVLMYLMWTCVSILVAIVVAGLSALFSFL